MIKGFWLVPWLEGKPAAERERVLNDVMSLLADQVIVPYCGTIFPLEKAVEAVAAATAAARGGKVLLEG